MSERPKPAPPIFAEPLDESRRQAKAAMERMDRHVIPSVPPNFHVWYEFTSDRNPDLKRAIEQLIAAREPFTPEVCATLYRKFVRDHVQDPVADEVARQLLQTISHLQASLADTSNGSSQINNDLMEVTAQIGTATTSELARLASVLLNTANRMLDLNTTLKAKVDKSAGEIGELERNLRIAREQAARDGVTGIGNRQYFDGSLVNAMVEATNDGRPLALALVDIDHFKNFNDTYGHTTGDAVLRKVAMTMMSNIKGRDIVARYGGEEFGIIFPNTSGQQALNVMKQILTAVEAISLTPTLGSAAPPRITVSSGIATYMAGDSTIEFINRADAALYEAKRNGRNRAVLAQ